MAGKHDFGLESTHLKQKRKNNRKEIAAGAIIHKKCFILLTYYVYSVHFFILVSDHRS